MRKEKRESYCRCFAYGKDPSCKSAIWTALTWRIRQHWRSQGLDKSSASWLWAVLRFIGKGVSSIFKIPHMSSQSSEGHWYKSGRHFWRGEGLSSLSGENSQYLCRTCSFAAGSCCYESGIVNHPHPMIVLDYQHTTLPDDIWKNFTTEDWGGFGDRCKGMWNLSIGDVETRVS